MSATLPVETLLVRGAVGWRAAKSAMMGLLSLLFVAGGVCVLVFTPDWKWGVGIIGFFSLGIVFGASPLLRAGRYEVTTHRLVWRPYFTRRMREIPLAAIAAGDVEVDADSATIKVRSHDLEMGSIASFEVCWGALVLGAGLARLAARRGQAPVEGLRAAHTSALTWRAQPSFVP